MAFVDQQREKNPEAEELLKPCTRLKVSGIVRRKKKTQRAGKRMTGRSAVTRSKSGGGFEGSQRILRSAKSLEKGKFPCLNKSKRGIKIVRGRP